MANQKVYTTLFAIAGELQSSFKSSFAQAERTFAVFESKAKAVSKNVEHSFSKLGESIERSLKPLHSLGHLTGIGTIIGGGLGLLAGHELLKGGYETRAEREVLQNQLHAILASRNRQGEQTDVDSMIRRFSDNEAPVKYEPAMEAVNRLLSSNMDKFNSTAKLHDTISRLADLSRDENTFGLVSNAYTKMQAMHRVDRQHLNEIDLDSGFSVSQEMAKAAGMTTDKFAAAMKAHKIGQDQLLTLLDSAITKLTSQGGPAFEHALQQMKGLKGIATRVEERFRDFKEAVGSVEEAFISPFMESLLSAVGPDQLKHVFDGILPSVTRLGENIKAAFNWLTDTGRFSHTGKILKDIFSLFSSKKDADTWSFVDGVTSAWDKLNSGLDKIKGAVAWMRDNKGLVENAVKGIVGAFAGLKAIEIGANLASLIADATPLGLAFTAIAAGGAWIAAHWGDVSKFFTGLWESFSKGSPEEVKKLGSTFADMGKDLSAIGTDMGDIANKFWPLLKPVFEAIQQITFGALNDSLMTIKTTLDLIKNAADLVRGALNFQGVPVDVNAVKQGSYSAGHKGGSVVLNPNAFPKNAKGGLFSSAQLGWYGEAGPEALIPLNGSDRSMGLLERAAASMGVSTSYNSRAGHTFQIAPNITVQGGANGVDAASLGRMVCDIIRSEVPRMAQEEEWLSFA